ncbi:Cof-type HAD-IIB family hydrolase [Fructilactobacillus vespulae]|uniref:Cof-type HAD-IIB family hydrolase n=1 Tax=Fructilactobacillus vespulae TaxID=1249630 RepID=UPI0039B48B97
MYKYLVFFDLDSTLFDADSKVNDEVADALDQIRDNGGLPIIATGRTLYEIPDTIAKTKINTLVISNGAYGIQNGKKLFHDVIEPQTIDQLDEFAKENGNSITVLNQKGKGSSRHDDLLIKACDLVHAPIPPVVSKSYWYDNPIDMMFVTNTNLDDKYQEKFGDKLSFFRNSPFSIDIVAHNVSKATGIKQLIDAAGYQGIPTYAFGDGNNDIPMLDFVDHAVAMGNGKPNVKDHAEFVTTANTDSGIVNGLKHFNLI